MMSEHNFPKKEFQSPLNYDATVGSLRALKIPEMVSLNIVRHCSSSSVIKLEQLL